MKPDLSEFSYGYALTSEITQSLGSKVAAAPVFPSLYQEGKKGGGYDVKIPNYGVPLFLQFKLSHFMSHANSKEIQLLGAGYYRWHLHALRRSDQHNLLLDLESNGNDVFYVAPFFHQTAELNSHYISRSIVQNSAAFRPSDIGPLPDQEEHYVVFNRHAAYRCSNEPQPTQFSWLDQWLESIAKEAESKTLGAKGIAKLGESIIASIESAKARREPESKKSKGAYRKEIDIDEVRRVIEERPQLSTIGYIARTALDAELLILNPRRR